MKFEELVAKIKQEIRHQYGERRAEDLAKIKAAQLWKEMTNQEPPKIEIKDPQSVLW